MNNNSQQRLSEPPCVYVIEQRLPRGRKWYPWVAYAEFAEAAAGMRRAKKDNLRSDWQLFRVRKYVSIEP